MTRICASRVALFAAVAVLAAAPSQAQSTVKAGPEFRVNEFTAGDQRFPVIAEALSGIHLVVWESDLQDGDSTGIFGRFLGRFGVPTGPEFRINQTTAGAQIQPAVTVDTAGRFTVVWTSTDGSGAGVFARQFSSSGPLGPEFAVNTFTAGDQSRPQVSAGPAGVAVVWQSSGQDGAGQGVYGRLFTPTGVPATGEFRLSAATAGDQVAPVVAALDNGRYAVAWAFGTTYTALFSRLFDGAGNPVTTDQQLSVGFVSRLDHLTISRAALAAGTFAVAWWSASIDAGKDHFLSSDLGIRLQYFDANGVPTTTDGTGGAGIGTVARWQGSLGTSYGGFLVAHASVPGVLTCFTLPAWPGPFCTAIQPEDGSGSGIFVRGLPGLPRVQVNTFTAGEQTRPSVASDVYGNGIIVWQSQSQDGSGLGVYAQRFGGLFPEAMSVDPSGNGVIDPGVSESVRPTWRNENGSAQTFGGTLFGYVVAGGTTTVDDGTASYGTVANDTAQPCVDCYAVSVSFPSGRPATHVDGYLGERITPVSLQVNQVWFLHVGGSFTDVSATSPFYRFIETLLHRGVTTGCGTGVYCPGTRTTRDQMAVFVLAAKEYPGYAPPACGVPLFADVPASSPFCKWIEELARRGVVGGCGGGNYCPSDAVTREQMAVFVLRTLDPALNPPACTTPLFADVPASSPFCKWIEELARRGVVSGCGGGNYCPTSPVTREQMAVFLAGTFGLTLY